MQVIEKEASDEAVVCSSFAKVSQDLKAECDRELALGLFLLLLFLCILD